MALKLPRKIKKVDSSLVCIILSILERERERCGMNEEERNEMELKCTVLQ